MPPLQPHRRRAASGLLSALACVAAPAMATDTRHHAFEVLLDGKPIGSHSFHISATPDGTERVQSEASFQVKLLGITLYRYQHRAEEHWDAGCLQRIAASTSDNGRKLEVRGARAADAFRLEQPAAKETRAGCISSYSYWAPQRLLRQRELLNPQTGKFDTVQFEDLGEEVLDLPGGKRSARRHRMSGEGLSIDLWYGPDGQWLQLASRAAGDRQLLYRLRD